MFSTKINKINICCWILYCLYAIFNLTIFGLGVYFLESLGCSYAEIGMTIGISAIISTIAQPLIGRYADKRQYSWKNILLILSAIMLICSLAMFFAPDFLVIYLFAIMVIVVGAIYPFLNTGVFYYMDHGVDTDFGISRGFASLSYMAFSAIIGFFLIGRDVMVINGFTLAAAIIMILIICLLPYYGSNVNIQNKSEGFKNNVLSKYPLFTLIFIAVALFMIFHHIFVCYMINIFQNLGGGIADVTAANSIGALLELPTMFLFYKILEKVSVKKLFLFASIMYVVRALIVFTAQDTTAIYVSVILQMLTFAIIIPASVHLADSIVDNEDKYEAQAFMGATLTIGLIFANLLGGNILHWFDINILLASLLFFAVMGCIFAFSSLLIDGRKEKSS